MTVEAAAGIDPADLGITLIQPATIAGLVFDLATDGGTGRCRAIWSTGEPVDWNFAGPEQLLPPS
jgi:hypothetical protein